MNDLAPTPRLFALLVGINQYRPPVGSLRGCLNDLEKVRKYLVDFESKNFALHIEMLPGAKATRDQVISHFKNHLAKATANDVVLFYYSGHGAQEMADPAIWRFEPDQKLETLVLYDSVPIDLKNVRLLADKELRYLLHYVATRNEKNEPKAASPHLVVITDCCHSGENTRGDLLETAAGALAKMTGTASGDAFPVRPWEGFCFTRDISQETLKTKPLAEVIPQAAHVSLAACQAHEKAWEVDGVNGERGGVFTQSLIEILKRSQGTVTYRDLRSRIQHYIKGQHQQVPQIYAVGEDKVIYKTFLGRNVGSKPLHANVLFNEKMGWIMDMGIVHGISPQVADGIVVLNDKNEPAWKADIKAVHLEYTQLVFPNNQVSPTGKEYKSIVRHFFSAPTNVYLPNQGTDEAPEKWLRKRLTNNGQNLNLVPSENQADYSVQIDGGHYVITKPFDPNRPLVLPAKIGKEGADQTYRYLQHISQFDYVKNLENTANNQLHPEAIKVEFFQTTKNGDDVPQPIFRHRGKEVIEMAYNDEEPTETGEKRATGSIKIKLTNEFDAPLYVALVYLSNDFQSFTELISGVQRLEPGGAVWAAGGNAISLNYDTHVQVLNLPSTDLDFKIIISQQPFDISPFELEALPTFSEMVFPQPFRSISSFQKKKTSTTEGDTWTTRLLTLRIANPNYNFVSRQELGLWLQTAGSEYIKGIYLYDGQLTNGTKQKLKDGICWRENR